MPAKLKRIKDDSLRGSLEQAQASLRSGDYLDVVQRCADAYLELLVRKPEMLKGPEALRSILFFPRLGAHLVQEGDGSVKVVYDREEFTFSEAVTYFEFAVDSLARHEL
jgi:hypothetical protein